jgi:hypothetical protein
VKFREKVAEPIAAPIAEIIAEHIVEKRNIDEIDFEEIANEIFMLQINS